MLLLGLKVKLWVLETHLNCELLCCKKYTDKHITPCITSLFDQCSLTVSAPLKDACIHFVPFSGPTLSLFSKSHGLWEIIGCSHYSLTILYDVIHLKCLFMHSKLHISLISSLICWKQAVRRSHSIGCHWFLSLYKEQGMVGFIRQQHLQKPDSVTVRCVAGRRKDINGGLKHRNIT